LPDADAPLFGLVGFASSVPCDVVFVPDEVVDADGSDDETVDSVELESVSVDMIMIVVAKVKGCLSCLR